jgi:hypothetical protein
VRKESEMKHKVKAFAVTCTLVWGLGVFFLTWWIIAFEGATGDPTWLGHLYRGYRLTPLGSLVGLVWGFFDALAGGFVFAWPYNWLVSRSARSGEGG